MPTAVVVSAVDRIPRTAVSADLLSPVPIDQAALAADAVRLQFDPVVGIAAADRHGGKIRRPAGCAECSWGRRRGGGCSGLSSVILLGTGFGNAGRGQDERRMPTCGVDIEEYGHEMPFM
jgi:hypothetical protein